jgi:outer membrane protein OmpA-like peptidoglycan-associated protein
MDMNSLLLLAILFLVGGCGTWQSKPQAAQTQVPQSKYQFDYNVTNGEPIGLVRVFDDGGSTYFQFRGNPPEAFVVSAETTNGESIIPHEMMGNYAVIRGVYRTSSVPAAAKVVKIEKLGAIAPMASMGPVILPKMTKDSAPTIEPGPLPVVVNSRASDSSSIRQIRFRRNSAALNSIGRKALAEMIATTASAGDVEIRVRPYYPNRRASVRLAESRAKAIRQVLVEAGVGESRVRISRDGGTPALVAEVEFLATPSQASRDTAPIGMGIEQVIVSVQLVEFSSPLLPTLSISI